jgi:hypothetical protein
VIVDDVELVVIPTEWKSKLPQTLSYPVGAEMFTYDEETQIISAAEESRLEQRRG